MSTAQWISTVIFFLWPLVAAIAFWLFQFLIQRLPAHTRLALEQFTQMAVKNVEQQSIGIDGMAKKALAVNLITKLFEAYGLPLPPLPIINIAIEAAVNDLTGGVPSPIPSPALLPPSEKK